MKKSIVIIALIAGLAHAADTDQFYVYTEAGSRLNHFIPSGWMGDFGDLKMNQRSKTKAAAGQSCIEISYSGERKQQAGWAGIYWQFPADNWGNKKVKGFDLSKYKRLSFYVKGAKGGEYIDKFFVGGITGQTEAGDSDQVSSDAVELTKQWQLVTVDLKGADLSHIIGGFGFALNADMNNNGATFYIDEIVFEK